MAYHPLTAEPNSGEMGTIYLLHFDGAYGHAKHYLGWAKNVDARLAHHAKGTGARLTAAAAAAGVHWSVARTWVGDRNEERRLHNRGGQGRHCPVCQAEAAQRREAARAQFPLAFAAD